MVGDSSASGGRPGARRRLWPALAVSALGVGLMVAAAAVSVSGDDQVRVALAPEAGQGDVPPDERALAETFSRAADLLAEAGTFRYEGTREYRDVDPGRHPDPLRYDFDPGEGDVHGEVELPGDARDLADFDGAHVELVIVSLPAGPANWARRSAYTDRLDNRPWVQVGGGEFGPDMSLLPEWLDGATDHFLDGVDGRGRPIIRATVAPALFGSVRSIDSAEIALTVDDEGRPRTVDLKVKGGAVLEQHVQVKDLGADLSVDLPGAAVRDPTPSIMEEDLALFTEPVPLGLAGVPAGWSMRSAGVVPYRSSGCRDAIVTYADETAANWLAVHTLAAGCLEQYDAGDGEPLAVAGFSGVSVEEDDGQYSGTLVSGDVGLGFRTTLAPAEARQVLETLVAFDPEEEPSHIQV